MSIPPLPPVHPILVNFTAALVPAAFISDVLGRLLRRPSLNTAAWWMLLYAAIITPLTVIAGWVWLRQIGSVDLREMTIHKWLGTGLAIVFFLIVWWRWRYYRREQPPGWSYLLCLGLVVAALTVQGHLGGLVTFGDVQSASTPTNGTDARRQQDTQLQWRDSIEVKD